MLNKIICVLNLNMLTPNTFRICLYFNKIISKILFHFNNVLYSYVFHTCFTILYQLGQCGMPILELQYLRKVYYLYPVSDRQSKPNKIIIN